MPISPLPPLCPHDTSATSPLAGLDITRDDSCQHQWSPLLGTLLFEVPCTGWCWQSVTSMVSPAWWAFPLAAPCHHLESQQQLGHHGRRQRGVVLQGQPGLAQALRHPTPCPGCQRPWAPGRDWGGPVPLAGLASEHEGGVAQVFSVSTCPWPVLGEGCEGPWVGSGGPGGLFTATELVSFHLPRGKQLAIC